MHKFWAIAVGCALSVGMGVASDPDQVDEKAANSGEDVHVVKVPDLGREQLAIEELETLPFKGVTRLRPRPIILVRRAIAAWIAGQIRMILILRRLSTWGRR